jgi:hypothetical protein
MSQILDETAVAPVGVRVVVVPADESVPTRVVVVEPGHGVWCDLVGDVSTDTVFAADGSAMVKVPVSGKREGRPVNVRASMVVDRLVPGFAKVDRVHGDAVVVGLDAEWDAADVLPSLVDVLVR